MFTSGYWLSVTVREACVGPERRPPSWSRSAGRGPRLCDVGDGDDRKRIENRRRRQRPWSAMRSESIDEARHALPIRPCCWWWWNATAVALINANRRARRPLVRLRCRPFTLVVDEIARNEPETLTIRPCWQRTMNNNRFINYVAKVSNTFKS